jgi:8-oxo-dGTP pyrophosphatase MutT (NUDIX family)
LGENLYSGYQVDRLTEQVIERSLQPFGNTCKKRYVPNRMVRLASVLVPMFIENDEWHLLFTRRTDTLQFHKGQVSFPGGVCDHGDESPKATALRESCEEISLKSDWVKVLGCLPTFTSHTNYQITPVVGRIQWPIGLTPNPDEVHRIFSIPLHWLAEANHREWKPFLSPNGNVNRVIYFQPYDGEILWGITARITVMLINAFSAVG